MPHVAPRPLIGKAEQVVDWVPTEGEVAEPLNKDIQRLLAMGCAKKGHARKVPKRSFFWRPPFLASPEPLWGGK